MNYSIQMNAVNKEDSSVKAFATVTYWQNSGSLDFTRDFRYEEQVLHRVYTVLKRTF